LRKERKDHDKANIDSKQIIVEEGQTVPGDSQLICDYKRPGDYEKYIELKNEDKFTDEPTAGPGANNNNGKDAAEKARGERDAAAAEDDYEVTSLHYGHPILACDQSAITGESLAVDKYMGDILYYTTGCKRGKGYAIVTTSAKWSFVGRTAELVQGAKDQGHFQAVMDSIGRALLVLVMFFILVAWIGGFYHHLRIATPGSQNLLHYTLVLLIIGVPVGLPVVTTTTLAVGAAYLAKQKAIVQKLTAIESLAVSGYLTFTLSR
jgi:H+-transporting ATPase